ncbi:MAG: S41 family peptidase, partial [Bacteroidota bacterium]
SHSVTIPAFRLMNKNHLMRHLLILCFFSPLSLVWAQSTATIPVDQLASLGKVWGFLKYYHPQIAAGKTDWDSVLVTDLPRLETKPSSAQLNQIISNWLETYGPVEACNECEPFPSDSNYRNLDLAFLEEDLLLSLEIRKQLQHIRDNHHQGAKYYALPSKWDGPVDFENEKPYKEMRYPTRPYRMLALFRYWNAVQYYFPYKYHLERDWAEVLEEYVPVLYEAQDSTAYIFAMRRLTAQIYDSHSFFNSCIWNNAHGDYRLLMNLQVVEDEFMVRQVHANEAGERYPLQKGDVIVSINGEFAADRRDRLQPYLIASNDITTKRNIGRWLLLGDEPEMELVVRRGEKTLTYQVEGVPINSYYDILKNQYNQTQEPKWKIMPNNIAYVDMGRLEWKEVRPMMRKIKNCQAIIFDVRNYPKGTMYRVGEYLMPQKAPFVTFTYPDPELPGRFLWYEEPYRIGTKSNKKYYQGKVIVLQNETTQSHAEFTIMSLQVTPDCTVIGSQTAGADGNVTFLWLPGGAKAAFTGLGVYYPDGRETQRIGIVPDREIKPTIAGMQAGKDEVLEYAIDFIKSL